MGCLPQPSATMKNLLRTLLCFRLVCALICALMAASATLSAQAVNAVQQVTVQGLRSSGAHGSFVAAQWAPDGTVVLLLDEHDGIRLLKVDSSGTNLLTESQTGAASDAGVALALDPGGNIYVTGTTTSGTLSGTGGTAFPRRADTSTNSFLARYDSNLNLLSLTFLGAGHTAAASVAATADAVFVAGTTYSAAFPITAAAIEQVPAAGSTGNGFVERFSPDLANLVYATYLTGAGGDTNAVAVAADATDHAYTAGATSASGLPTFAALQPRMLGLTSGFLTKLTPAGDGLVFSTFLAGAGITSLAYDSSSNSLLLAGNIAPGQFPVATVSMPLASANYGALLRIPADGQTLSASVLLPPGAQDLVAVGPNGTAWVSGTLSGMLAGTIPAPLFPGATPPDYNTGDSFLVHLTAAGVIDQTLRFGGTVVDNPSYASLTSTVAAPAVSADGATAFLPGSINATVSSSLLSTQRFDFPFVSAPSPVLLSSLRDILPSPAACAGTSQCSGSGALLARVSIASSAPSLSLSTDDLPNLTLRNRGSATASGLAISSSGFSIVSNCGTALHPSQQCAIALTGAGPGTITVSAANAPAYTQVLTANSRVPDALVLSASELDFGIQTSTSPAATRTVTVTNLSSAAQTFSSALDGGPGTSAYSFAEAASDCSPDNSVGTHVLGPGSSCHITLGLTVSSSAASDGPIRAAWKIGPRELVLTGFAQAASLNLSGNEVDFGLQFTGPNALHLPRFLYLSNNSTTSAAHTLVSLPPSSPFSILDECPSVLEPRSVCRLTLTYSSPSAPSSDSVTLALDAGLSVLVTGETMAPAGVTASITNPSLRVSSNSLAFATAVVTTGVSAAVQSVTVKNTGALPMPVSVTVIGDFSLTNACGAMLVAGASCQVLVKFTPSQPGLRQGLLSIATASGFAPALVTLSGTGLPLLPANNGLLDLGQTLAGEPLVVWYKVQQSLPSLTVATGGSGFGVALVEDTGIGHGSLPPSSFSATTSSTCANCWLGIEFLSQTAADASTPLTLTTVAGGQPYMVALTANALPVQGLLLTPVTQDFGPVAINSSSAPVTFTLANLLVNPGTVTIQSVTAAGDFSVVPSTLGGLTCSGAISATASCFVQVVFSPTASGTRTGTLTLVTSAGTVSTPLTGYGSPDPGIAFNPDALQFSDVPGSAATQAIITLSNTGSDSVVIGTPSAADPSFTVNSGCSTLSSPLSPGSLCTLQVTFTPGAAPITSTLTVPVSVTLNGQTTSTFYSIPLNGGYTTQDSGLQILPGEVNFGSAATGSMGYTRLFTVHNLTAKALNLRLSMPRQFVLSAPDPCTALPANGTCQFPVTFLPSAAGALTGSMFAQGSAVDGSGSVEAIGYMLGYGTGAGQLSITGYQIPNMPLSFGEVSSGQSQAETLTLRNTGTGPLTIRRLTSEPPFLTSNTCLATLPAGASCQVTVTYSPIYEVATGSGTTSPRSDAGTLVIESDADTSPDLVDLSGIAAPVASPAPANAAVLAAFDLSQSALTFANVTVGNASATQTVTLTNTGTTALQVSAVLPPIDFRATSACATIFPGDTCNIAVQFAPTDASSAAVRSGALEIVSNAATSLEFISLLGSSAPAALSLTPVALDFGTVNVGAIGTLNVAVTNTSSVPVTFGKVTADGDYAVQPGTCPDSGGTVAAGASCTLHVSYTPSATGARTGTLYLSSNATQLPLTVSLVGNAVQAHLQVTPGALAFGPVTLGASSSLSLMLVNTGTGSVTNITSAFSGVNPNDFAVVTPCAASSLSPGSGCTMAVRFTPSTAGARAATLVVASSDLSSPAIIALAGTGALAGSFTLTVNGSSSASVSVKSGSPATYTLSLTPAGGFSGNVALTCDPIQAGQYASCSLLSSTLALSGGPQAATATINTITSVTASAVGASAMAALLFGPFAFLRNPRRRRAYKVMRASGSALSALVALVAIVVCLWISGCGSGIAVQQQFEPAVYATGHVSIQGHRELHQWHASRLTVILTLIVQ